MDTQLYDLSIPIISSLQNQLSGLTAPLQMTSVVFDPKYAFLIYSPIAYLFDQKVGKRLILASVIAEWLNMILKWCLHGERPYWYVHSSGHFDAQQVPIQQFPITCELGPGHPSGHAMVAATVWYIILDAALQFYGNHLTPSAPEQQLSGSPTAASGRKRKGISLSLKLSVWALFTLLLALVSVSRVYLGCHFPHQCLAGSILGILVARWVSRLDSKPMHFIVASVLLLSTAFGAFGLLQALGFDPSWTIKLATKYCIKREYIHLDTAPFFSIMRYSGFAFGTGLGLYFPLSNYYYTKQLVEPSVPVTAEAAKDASNNLSWFSVKILMALLMARLVDNLGLFVSHANLPLFYSSAFCAYTLFSFALISSADSSRLVSQVSKRRAVKKQASGSQ